MTFESAAHGYGRGLSVQHESDIVWGAKNIGAIINRSPRQAFYLLENGVIKSARKFGDRYAVSKSSLVKEFGAGA